MANLKQLSDEDLAVHIRQVDQEAYAQIITRYQDKLIRYATYLIADADVAADAVQSAFIKAFINLNSFDPKKKFSSWLYRITHNEAVNHIKKEKPTLPWKEWSFSLSSDTDLEADLENKDIKKQLTTCLNKLSLKYKEPLVLYYLQERGYEEISDILRLPIGTVGTRIARGKIALKKICQ